MTLPLDDRRAVGRADVLVARAVATLDAALRCAVIVVLVLLIVEFWDEPEPGSDGVPVRLLIAPIVVYAVWNAVVVGSSLRRWHAASLAHPHFMASLAGLGALRMIWLQALANDWWWHHRNPLTALVVASGACTVVALLVAVRLAGGRAAVFTRGARSDHAS